MPLKILLPCAAVVMLLQAAPPRLYTDPRGRFTFSYPAAFGTTSPGTDDGFEDRVAAVRFSTFPAVYGGEAVLTRGFPLIDLGAVGGLYDGLTLQIFPAPLRARVVAQLPRLTAASFCAALEQSRHLDPALPALGALTPQERQAIGQADLMRNADARVVECRATGEMVTFDKERAFQPGSPPQHVYGAVRFLPEPDSTFQLIAGGTPPTPALRATIEDIVGSFARR